MDRQTMMWTGGVIAVTAAFTLAVTRPQLRRVRELAERAAIARSEWADAAARETSIKALEREVQALAEQARQLDARVPDGEVIGPLFEEVARLAENHRLRPTEVEPGKPIRTDRFVSLPIGFKLAGPFPAVYALIRDIERLPRLIRIERFDAEADKQATGNVTAEVRLRVFSRAS